MENNNLQIIDLYNDLLQDLKKITFNKIQILSLSKDALKLVAVWPSVDRRILSTPIGNKALHPAWHYVWFDYREWGRLANVPNPMVWDYFNSLAKSNIIYPDGTMPEKVMEYLSIEADELTRPSD